MTPTKHLSKTRTLTVTIPIAILLFMTSITGCSPQTPTVVDSNLVIPTSDITSTPSFYPIQINGVKMNVIAYRAKDNTIRTAFDACVTCYKTGDGFYRLKGDTLVCSYCGNTCDFEQIGIPSDACSPVAITADDRIDTADTITIPLSFMQKTIAMLENQQTDTSNTNASNMDSGSMDSSSM